MELSTLLEEALAERGNTVMLIAQPHDGENAVIQVGNAWVIIRLNAHAMPGKTPFDTVQKKLSSDLQKQKTVEVRAALNQKLHQGAKIEVRPVKMVEQSTNYAYPSGK